VAYTWTHWAYIGGGECYIWTGLQPNKCGGLKHKGLYWGEGGFDSEVYSVTKKQQIDSFMRRYDYGLISQW
jgi:hypothetical protein